MSAELWALVPAAGVGSRMGSAVPKQYLSLGWGTVLAVTLQQLLATPGLVGIVVVLAPGDERFASLPIAQHPNIHVVTGGEERADSVLSGLEFMRHTLKLAENAQVLVHDAARPCVTQTAIRQLLDEVGNSVAGGILAVPVADTLKYAAEPVVNAARIEHTQDRRQLWLAHTPQLFPLGLLSRALRTGLEAGAQLTDEASAVERLGYQPRLVVDRRDNIKITQPEDLWLAEQILRRHQELGL